METGPTGVAGANVVKHVNKESNQETENARHPLLSMVENHAMASQTKFEFATRMYLVQVKILRYVLKDPVTHLPLFENYSLVSCCASIIPNVVLVHHKPLACLETTV